MPEKSKLTVNLDASTVNVYGSRSVAWMKERYTTAKNERIASASLVADRTCCGIKHLFGFNIYTDAGKERDEALVLMLIKAREASLGRLMCSLNGEQNRVWSKALEKAEYKLLEKFLNRNTSHQIYFYSAEGTAKAGR